ncbi:hypothetical protein MSAN_01177200 [Mycena sanguinolenta]|uniref:F-box domain-containing protein n=1 Tax=Mycena sanguinolenta TaxID=230812 RepID=A0A8H6YMJ5_9AGAR|nr:hypothetical protein MSAN_01177200 [Mycena sanguinolenta]
MSVRELRARIAKLDTEIDIQRELLKKLERDKSLIQRQLNKLIDPVARLPLEISSEIFLQCMWPFPDIYYGAHNVPMLLLNISHAWTDIALSTPALWSAINIAFPCPSGLKELLPIWLERARNRPLSISLEVRERFDEEVVAIVWGHGQQMKHLQVFEEEIRDRRWSIEEMIPGQLPALQTLTMRGEAFTRRYILQLLRLAPNLIEYVVYDTRIDPDDVEKVVLPQLRRLAFGEPGGYPCSDQELLEYLSLPVLEALQLETSGRGLLAFLKQSSPPLLELILKSTKDIIDFVALAEYVAGLIRLEVWFPKQQEVETLFAVLASQSLLLHLHTLIIHLDLYRPSQNSDDFWTALVHALAARRTQIQVFRLMVPLRLPDSLTPASDIAAAIQELRTDGMHVSISATHETWSLFD